jgi:hypothetical protein
MISTDIKVTGAESLDSFRSQTSSFSKISVRILFTLVSSIFSAAFRFLEPLPTFFQSDLRVSKKRISALTVRVCDVFVDFFYIFGIHIACVPCEVRVIDWQASFYLEKYANLIFGKFFLS